MGLKAIDLGAVKMINSKEDALEYWTTEFGSPEFFEAFEELNDVDKALEDFKAERKAIETEIFYRDAKSINSFKINRAIELYFLVSVGITYLNDCSKEATFTESDAEPEYEKNYKEDDLFTRNYEEN